MMCVNWQMQYLDSIHLRSIEDDFPFTLTLYTVNGEREAHYPVRLKCVLVGRAQVIEFV